MDANDALWACGAVLIAGGAAMIYLPAGIILAGATCLGFAALGLGKKVGR